MAVDPASAIAAGIASTIKILEVVYLLKAADEQTTDLLRTTEHVERNVKEARRLLRLKASHITDEERSYMLGVVADNEKALLEVAQLIEPARVDIEITKSINPKNRILWVFRDSPKVRDKHGRLAFCHQALMTVIGALYGKDVVVLAPLPSGLAEDDPPPYNAELEAMFNWRKRQKRRRKSTANSIGDKGYASSPRSTPIPGSPVGQRKDSQASSTILSPLDVDLERPHSALAGNWATSTTAVLAPPHFLPAEAEMPDFQSLRLSANDSFPPTQPGSSNASIPVLAQPLSLVNLPTTTGADSSTSDGAGISCELNNCQNQPPPSNRSSMVEKEMATQTSVQDAYAEALHRSPGLEVGVPGPARAATKTRGRQWLACYAARSDIVDIHE